MRAKLTIGVLLLGFATAVKCGAEGLPPSRDLFSPLLADPRELQYAVRALMPVSRKLLGEAAIGDYLGLYRWSCDPGGTCFQVDVGGGAFGRFDLSGTSNDMQSVDWYANLPLDWRHGPWSGRFMIYHTSSHLGDDFLKTHGGVTNKHAWDNLRWLAAYEPNGFWRFYGGYTYVFRTLPEDVGRHALQGGVEAKSRWLWSGRAQWYWANDFQSWERAEWNPMFTSQAGVRLSTDPHQSRAVSLFVEFESGRQPQGQFYLQQETHWDLGAKFDL